MKYSERYIGGIYTIRNKINGNLYIGSAVSFYHRWAGHKTDLRANRHDNPKLQSAWNKYREDNFDFSILEEIENKDSLLEVEQFYLDVFFGRDCYNILPTAKSRKGSNTSDETKDKLRKYKNILILSPDGIEYMVENARDFSRAHNLQITALCEVLAGKRVHHKGWHLPGTELITYSIAHEDGRIVKLIDGEVETFCKLYKLSPKPLKRVANGTQKWHNGWYAVCVIGKPDNIPGRYLRGNYK